VSVLLAMFLAVGASVGYTAHAQRGSNQRWCDLLVSLDQPVPAPAPGAAPLTARAKVINQQIHQLRVELGCR
jgi:hypothetical protein